MKRTLLFALTFFLSLSVYIGCAPEAEPDEADEMADDMAEQHQDDTTEATAIVMEPRIPTRAHPVNYHMAQDSAYVGYLASPMQPDSIAMEMGQPGDTLLPGLIIVHEWWGLNPNITAMARRLAGEGFRVLAVDLYGGTIGNTPDEAQALMGDALRDEDELRTHFRQAYQFLSEQYQTPEVGVLGWCFGGRMALLAATTLPQELDAAVIYYGQIGDFGEEALQPLDMPILSFFGGQDSSIPLDDVNAFEATLSELGKDVEIHTYDEAGHAFANPTGQNYNEAAAEDAWDKTIAFLKEELYNR